MGMIDKINEFVNTMVKEQDRFSDVQSEISSRRAEVEAVLRNLSKNEKEIVDALRSRVSRDEGMVEIFNQTSGNLFETIQTANSRLEEAVKGMAFIKDFEKRFTVSVFGKVKAGKSYIGNFVMGQPLRKEHIASAYDTLGDLTVHVYDRGKLYEQKKLSTLEEEKECNGAEFYVNNSEATSTIQWVNIGGMCWFDTPGIGSITLENEDLAKEYIKNADLVIFACNSDAAGTRQEFAEIGQLHKMGKPLLLLLTQSDTFDYEIDDDGDEISILVPKSDKDRKDQEEYMLKTLREQGLEEVLKYADILTVSAYLAVEALKNKDEIMFEQSNMGEFLDKLTEITRNDAADIKRNTPKSRVNEMINSIIIDLNGISAEIENICSKIEVSKKNLEERKDWMLEQIKAEVNLKIIEIMAMAKTEVERSSSVISETELSDRINMAIIQVIQKVCTEEAISNTEKIPNLELNLHGIGDLKMRQEKIPYKYTTVHRVSRPPKGVFEHLGKFFFDKEYYTSESRTETRYSTFDIGVNDSEVANNIVCQLNNIFSTTIQGYIDYLTKGYYEPVDIMKRKTTAEIRTAIKQLEGLRM